MSICKLCLKEANLLNKSHIIPEFMYDGMYDSNHQLLSFIPTQTVDGKGFIKRPSLGEYEGSILCADCDQKVIGSLESYARIILHGGYDKLKLEERPVLISGKNQHGLELCHIQNVDYRRMKLFFLSILWRASISSRPLFNEVLIGDHEEVIRKMILCGDPGNVEDYPISFLTFANDHGAKKKFIAQPQIRTSSSGHTTYTFIIGGMVYCFYLNSDQHQFRSYVLTETIRPSNEMNVYFFRKGDGQTVIPRFYGLNNNDDNDQYTIIANQEVWNFLNNL